MRGTVKAFTSLRASVQSMLNSVMVLIRGFAMESFTNYAFAVLFVEFFRMLGTVKAFTSWRTIAQSMFDLSSLLSSISGCIDWRLP